MIKAGIEASFPKFGGSVETTYKDKLDKYFKSEKYK